MSSVFTKIINGELPCYKIYEDDKTFVFLDNNPVTRGHTLAIPKVEVNKIYDLPDEDFIALMKTAKKISKHMEEKLGRRIFWKVIGTDVPHAHVHLVPQDENWVEGQSVSLTPDEFEAIRAKLEYND